MSGTLHSRLRDATIVAVLLLAMLTLLPSPASAGDGVWGGTRGRFLAEPGCPAGGGGGGGAGVGDIGVDSGTADVDTGPAEVDETFSTSGLAPRGGAWSRATSYGCDPGAGRIGAGEGAVPTRIDAGAGGAAAASGLPAAVAVLTGLGGAGVGALRRRRR